MDDSKLLANQFIGAIAAGDLEAAFSLVAEDAAMWVDTRLAPAGRYDKRSLRELLGKFVHAVNGVSKVQVSNVVDNGQYAQLDTVWHLQLGGRSYVNKYHIAVIGRDGKIAAFVSSANMRRLQKWIAALASPRD